MDYKEKIEQLKKSCYGNAPCEIDKERLEAAQIIEKLIERAEKAEEERDLVIEEVENYMVQDVVDGNEPCGICANASKIPCECCNPKWRGVQKEEQ